MWPILRLLPQIVGPNYLFLYNSFMSLSVTRDICGTAKGYRKHKSLGEEKCQPCKDAYNVERRTKYYSTEKNRAHHATYRAKPEVQEKIKAYHKEYAKAKTPPKVLEARLRKRQEVLGAKWAKEIDARLYDEQETLYQEEKAQLEVSAQNLLDSILATTKPVNELLRKVRREKKVEEAKALRAQERKRRVDDRKAQKEAERINRRLEREEAKRLKALLPIEHGTSMGEYDRCKKRKQGACGRCKAFAAQYVREYNKRNPEKAAAWNRLGNNRRYRNARENGQEFYTRQDVLDKWGTDCHICNQPIDLLAPTQCGEPGWQQGLHLDHVVPLSKGGPDTLDNVKPSHGGCNIDKGATV